MLECQNKLDKRSYAIKVTADEGAEDSLREVENLVKLPNHPNIVQYYTCWRDTLEPVEIDGVKKVLGSDTQEIFKYEILKFNTDLQTNQKMFASFVEFQLARNL